MKKLFSLGNLYVSDFIKIGEPARAGREELTLCFDEKNSAVRLEKATDPNLMYGKYWYRSGINQTMTLELKDIVQECLKSIKTEDGDVWLDIACNDGTLLKFVPEKFTKVGIDPVDDTYKSESEKIADLIIQDFFTEENYRKSKFGHKNPKIITTIAMFYDLDEPIKFLKDVYNILDDEGLFVLQMSYTPLMIKQLAFDNICHEHVYYYTLKSIMSVLSEAKFEVVDCELNDVNGGSFRIYIRKDVAKKTTFRTSPFRDVANFRVQSILSYEELEKMNTPEPYMKFWDEINNLKNQTVEFVRKAKSEGKKVWGYGASTKGNTLLQWFGLDHTLIDGIAERSPYKFGLRTIGTEIPIYSEEEMREAKPDYLLVLPWHFINEFKEREKDFLLSGGSFIVPCPKFEIISGKDV